MKIRRICVIAAALGAVATSLGGTAASAAVHPATFVARETGYGATLSAAQFSARQQLVVDYGPCSGIVFVDDGQLASGTWWADVVGNCTAYH
jgi:hypothetical protein